MSDQVKTLKDVLSLGYEVLYKEDNVSLFYNILLDDDDTPLSKLETKNFKLQLSERVFDNAVGSYQLVNYLTNKVILDNVSPEEIIDYFNKKPLLFHPGMYLKDYIESKEMTLREFSKKSNISENNIQSLIDGKINIDKKLAKLLNETTGVSLKTWTNLQVKYDLLSK